MADIEKKRRNVLKPVLAVAACAALIVTGIFAGNGITSKVSHGAENNTQKTQAFSNFFILTAHAAENEAQSIAKSGKYTMQNSKITASYEDGAYTVEMTSESKFEVSGENIKSVRYQCENGTFGVYVDVYKREYLKQQNKYYDAVIPYSEDLQKLSAEEFSIKVFENYEKGEYDGFFKIKKPVSDYIKAEKVYDGEKVVGVGFVSNETYQSISTENNSKDITFTNYMNTTGGFGYACWNPDIKALFTSDGNASGLNFDKLSHDKLTITVEFNDGTVQIESYDLGFNENGNLEIEKIK